MNLNRAAIGLWLTAAMATLAAAVPRMEPAPHDDGGGKSVPYYSNLILAGGGLQVVSYVGALEALAHRGHYDDRRGGYRFRRIGGSSTGCLVGLMVALDVDPTEVKMFAYWTDVLTSVVDFDPKLITEPIPPLDPTASWYRGVRRSFLVLSRVTQLLDWWSRDQSPGLSGHRRLAEFIATHLLPLSRHAKSVDDIHRLTLAGLVNLTGHELSCFATRLPDRRAVRFGPDTTPDEPVLRAVYASMALPGLFKPLRDGAFALLDGSLVENFPTSMYDNGSRYAGRTLALSPTTDEPPGGDVVPGGDTGGGGDCLAEDDRTIPVGGGSRGSTFRWTQSTYAEAVAAAIRRGEMSASAAGKCLTGPEQSASAPTTTATLDYAGDLYRVVIERQSATANRIPPPRRGQIVYLDSPLQPLQYAPRTELISLAINRAYRLTMAALDDDDDDDGGDEVDGGA